MTRDVVDGHWADPNGDAAPLIGYGLWALPGLVDAHSHIPVASLDLVPTDLAGAESRAREALAAGVTLLLDKGWTDDTAIRVLDLIPPEERPDIEAARRLITSKGGYYPGIAFELEGGGLEQAVAEEAEAGGGWVKLIGDWPRPGFGPVANFTEDEMRLAVSVAASRGSRVAVHTMAREVPTMAVRAGVQSIEHGLFLTEDDIVDLGSRGGMWVPTILRIEETIAQLGAESSGGRLLREGLSNVGALLSAAVAAGVHVLAGTDLVGAPANVAAEALKMGEHGLSAAQVVDALSSSGLRATGRPTGFEIGAPADAVLFPADPLVEPGVLGHPGQVIRRGNLV